MKRVGIGLENIGSEILEHLMLYAQDPLMVYSFIAIFMCASSFGLPLPEEILIVSVGVLALSARDPAFGEVSMGLHPICLALVCFSAVFLSDLFVFYLGRNLRNQLEKWRFFRVRLRRRKTDYVRIWMERYGFWSAGLFRFTPGMRFPGHLACGIFGVRPAQFIAVDGLAALLSVPSQILLIAYFGEEILALVGEYKLIAIILLLFAATAVVAMKWRSHLLNKARRMLLETNQSA